MTVIYEDSKLIDKKIAATIGMFDGGHLGHQIVFERLIDEAKKDGLKSMVITFENSPKSVFVSDYSDKILMPIEEKLLFVEKMGIDYVLVMNFTQKFASKTAAEFICFLKNSFSAKKLVVGYDNKIGSDRISGEASYFDLAKKCGIDIAFADQKKDDKIGNISSSTIKKLIQDRAIEEASRLLGHSYNIVGKVVGGSAVGRTLGFATANISHASNKLLPPNGVYFVEVTIENEHKSGLMNIGYRPTLGSHEKNLVVEVHILDFDKNIYGKNIEVAVRKFLRKEQKFSSVEELKQQLTKDRETAMALMKNCGYYKKK